VSANENNQKGLRIKGLASRHVGPVSLDVAPGECVCISGKSGAGKSLLLRAIADLDVHEGELWVDDTACAAVSGPQWRRLVGYLPAESAWWYDTVGEHFGAIEEDRFATLGFGIDVLRWEVARLSTGERQRLALLRLLANAPRALLLDEPTASLDKDNVGNAETLIADYRRGTGVAVLWVSHDSGQVARVARRQLPLVGGKLEPAP
jgi:ABC-type iron transport system FetAB ATPase subunit